MSVPESHTFSRNEGQERFSSRRRFRQTNVSRSHRERITKKLSGATMDIDAWPDLKSNVERASADAKALLYTALSVI